MTDSSVLVQASPNSAAGISAADYYLLTPDSNGDYSKGTWRKSLRLRRDIRPGR